MVSGVPVSTFPGTPLKFKPGGPYFRLFPLTEICCLGDTVRASLGAGICSISRCAGHKLSGTHLEFKARVCPYLRLIPPTYICCLGMAARYSSSSHLSWYLSYLVEFVSRVL